MKVKFQSQEIEIINQKCSIRMSLYAMKSSSQGCLGQNIRNVFRLKNKTQIPEVQDK